MITRSKLVDAAVDVIEEDGFEGLRVEDVVRRAGVAKGTFFVHFPEKDALMDHLIGEQIEVYLDELPTDPAPRDAGELVDALMPLLSFLTAERYVFDVVYRKSVMSDGDAGGAIALALARLGDIVAGWVAGEAFRRDVSPALLAEGVQAFVMQSLALGFGAAQDETDMRSALTVYLHAWLAPKFHA